MYLANKSTHPSSARRRGCRLGKVALPRTEPRALRTAGMAQWPTRRARPRSRGASRDLEGMPLVEASNVRASSRYHLRISIRCLTAPAIFVFLLQCCFNQANRSIRHDVSPAEVRNRRSATAAIILGIPHRVLRVRRHRVRIIPGREASERWIHGRPVHGLRISLKRILYT